jgi:diguanylate cyclase (GGDEF)-like protein/PAS domain S-box-containing protein
MEIGRDAERIKSLSRHTLEQLVTHSSEGILLVDAKDSSLRVVYANPAYEDLSGHSLAELTGKAWPLAEREVEGRPELEKLRAALARREAVRVVVPDVRKDGTSWLSDLSVEPLQNARGELKYLLCIQKPVQTPAAAPPVAAENAPAVEAAPPPKAPAPVASVVGPRAASPAEAAIAAARPKLTHLNRIDQATGLLRVEHFLDLLQRDVAIARRDRRDVSFAILEVVEFDSYCQTFGVKAGDSCQRMIGVQLTRVLRRAADLWARYDGAALVAAVTGQDTEQLSRLMDQVVENVRQLGLHNPRAKSGRYIWTRYSVVAIDPGESADVGELIARARAELKNTPVPVTAPAHVIPSWAVPPESTPAERGRGKAPLAALT